MSKAKTRHQAAVIVAALGVAALLGGCGQIRGAMGLDKDAPDEFQVVARAPLALPPNYDLRPPEPGADRPQELSPTDTAAARILGRRASPAAAPTAAGTSVFGTNMSGPTVQAAPRAPVTVSSGGVSVLRDQLQLDRADPNIRQLVNRETSDFVYEEEYPLDKVLFWREKTERGVTVDATKESQRLRENSALGKPVDSGETPTIERKRGGIFSGIF